MPSETDIDFENLEYLAIFREASPSKLYEITHGPRIDPGWNMDLVKAQLDDVGNQTQKRINSTAFQYMPERVEEIYKQDMGFWGSDAVPTIDYWDFYFRQAEDGEGWYRRVILDWGTDYKPTSKTDPMPNSKNQVEGESHFLYTSGNRRYANSLSEILHCQLADCSAVAPFKMKSVRSLGWMLWGICDLQNRLHCKFTEAVFQSLLWYFRVASNEQLTRLRQAEFAQTGVIPNGIEFIKAQDRYTPPESLVAMAFARNRQLMAQNAAPFTQDFENGTGEKEMTATETMARINNVNSLVSGMLVLAYTYEEFCYAEICRRFCIKNNPNPDVRRFRLACLKADVPPEMLDAERWDITAERVLGGGNKTLEMAQVQFLQGLRKNLNPDAQRRVDHISIESATDDPALAEELASITSQKKVTSSIINAQYATERILKGLPFIPPSDAVFEDYIMVWMSDLGALIKQMQNPILPPTPEKLVGAYALSQAIEPMIKQLATDKEEKQKANQYAKALKLMVKSLKDMAQKLKQQMKQPGAGAGGNAAETMAKVEMEKAKTATALQGKQLMAQVDAQNMQESHANRTAQKQISFELEQQRKDRAANADIRRKHIDHMHETALSGIRALQESNAAPAND
jgi:hypothetical protein